MLPTPKVGVHEPKVGVHESKVLENIWEWQDMTGHVGIYLDLIRHDWQWWDMTCNWQVITAHDATRLDKTRQD